MPLYEYQCAKCGKRMEKIESVSGPHLRKCPYCSGKVERVLTAPAIQFKGSGWYVTDYASKSGGKETPASDGPGSNEKETAASSGKEPAAKDSSGKETRPREAKEKKTAIKK